MKTNLILPVLLFSALGLVGNHFSLSLLFGVDFLFGSIFAFLALIYAGPLAGILSGLIISLYTFVLWGHPYAVILFTAEMVFVSLLYARYPKISLLLYDTAYWVLIGMPLVWFFYHHAIGLADAPSTLVMLKQPINAIFNVIFAIHAAFYLSILFRTKKRIHIDLRQLLVSFFAAFAFVSAMGVMIVSANTLLENSRESLFQNLDKEARFLARTIDRYENRSGQALRDLIGRYTSSDRFTVTLDSDALPNADPSLEKSYFGDVRYQSLPTASMPEMVRWIKSTFGTTAESIHYGTVRVEQSASGLVTELQQMYIFSFKIILGIIMLTILAGAIIGYLILKPLRSLASISSNLPEKIESGHSSQWPGANISELSTLIDNFSNMEDAFKKLIEKYQNSQEMLEDRIKERTYELRLTNEKLKDLNENLESRIGEEIEKGREKDKMVLQHARQAAMGEMIGMIAHQWRQPITGMGMSVNNLLLDVEMDTVDNKKLEENLKLIDEQIRYLSKTIDDFRNFFKPNRENHLLSLDEIITESLGIIGKSLENSNIELLTDYTQTPKVSVPKNEVVQVILNIFKNAQDVFAEKEIPARELLVRTFFDDEAAIIIISDNAGGIPEEALNRIFEPYYSTKTEKTGTGLGLYMCRTIIEEHCNGTIHAYNDAKGAVFEIRFPLMGEIG